MKAFSLMWYGPLDISDLLQELNHDVSTTDKKYPFLNNYGFYIYLEKNKPYPPVYIGQAYSKNRSLRNRIRWEIVKDGAGCAFSSFLKGCQEHGINSSNLILMVGHINVATENGRPIEYNPYDIEMALIHKIGKKRYRRGRIEIHNVGNFAPLKETIEK